MSPKRILFDQDWLIQFMDESYSIRTCGRENKI